MCGYFCIEFIGFMLKGKPLLDYTKLFSPNDYEKNDKITLKYFQWIKRWRNHVALYVASIENSKILKYHTWNNWNIFKKY